MARKHEAERNEATKKMIIDAALQICLEEGYRAVTVRGIGEKIGYSTGVIYYHFKDKQDIMDSLDKRLDEETYNSISAISDPDKSLYENLSILYDFTCDLAYNNPETYKRIFVSSRIENNTYTKAMCLDLASNCLNKAAERGEIKNGNITEKAKCLLAYIIGYNLLFFEISRSDMESAKANKEAAIKTILEGIINF